MQHCVALAPGEQSAEKWPWGHKSGLVDSKQDFPLLQNGLSGFETREDTKLAEMQTSYFKQFIFFGLPLDIATSKMQGYVEIAVLHLNMLTPAPVAV